MSLKYARIGAKAGLGLTVLLAAWGAIADESVVTAEDVNAAAAGAGFVIRPYVYSILGQKIGVSWQNESGSRAPARQTIRIFNQGRLANEIQAQKDGDLNYAVLPLPACGFGDGISYQVTGDTFVNPISDIPCANDQRPVRFSFLADSQEGPQYAQHFAQQMREFPAAAILHGGDIVQTGDSEQDWVDYFKAMEPIGASRVLFPTVGNHEYRYSPEIPLWKHFFRFAAKDSHYAFDLGTAHIIALNSNFEDDPTQLRAQLAWLESQLQIPSKWKIVYFHHPAFSIGIANNSLAPKKEWQVVQNYFVPLFERYKVDLVLNGHVHLFEKSYKNGVYYITVGPAGGKMGWVGAENPYALEAADDRTVVHLEASPTQLRALSVNIDDKIMDDLIIRK